MSQSARIRSAAVSVLFATLMLSGYPVDAADEFAPATPHGKAGCPAGSFLDVGRGECWSCPNDYARTVFPVDGPQACERSPAFSPAEKHARGTGLLRTDCPKGQFWDPNGYCYSCPSGHARTADAVTSRRACAKPVKAAFAPATMRTKSAGCPAGTFLDVGRGECWSCPADWYRTVNPVTGKKACASTIGNIFAVDSSAMCTQVVSSLREGERGVARLVASLGGVLDPLMKPLNDGMRSLTEQISTPAELDKTLDELAKRFGPQGELIDEAHRIADQLTRSGAQLQSLLLDPQVMCDGTPAERDRRLSALGLRPNRPIRGSGLLDGLLIGNAHAAMKRNYLAVSVSASGMPPTWPLGIQCSLSLVTGFAPGQRGVFFSLGPLAMASFEKERAFGIAVEAVNFNTADIRDFYGSGALSLELSLAPGKVLREKLAKFYAEKAKHSVRERVVGKYIRWPDNVGLVLSSDLAFKTGGMGGSIEVRSLQAKKTLLDVSGSFDFAFPLPPTPY